MTTQTAAFEVERPRLVAVATRLLGDPTEAEDVVQGTWIRLHGNRTEIDNLPAWLTTVTTRLCLDRLKARTPVPLGEMGWERPDQRDQAADPADQVALADTVGVALSVVLDRLTPNERVAFVLHDSFGFEFSTIAALLDTTSPSARKLASRARSKVAQPAPEDALSDWEVVDAFMAAARGGDFTRLLELLAPNAVVLGDDAAITLGTPARIQGQREIAEFFNGAAHAALAVFVDGRPGAAWYDKGTPRVAFDFRIEDGRVHGITFRADPAAVATIHRRRDANLHQLNS